MGVPLAMLGSTEQSIGVSELEDDEYTLEKEIFDFFEHLLKRSMNDFWSEESFFRTKIMIEQEKKLDTRFTILEWRYICVYNGEVENWKIKNKFHIVVELG